MAATASCLRKREHKTITTPPGRRANAWCVGSFYYPLIFHCHVLHFACRIVAFEMPTAHIILMMHVMFYVAYVAHVADVIDVAGNTALYQLTRLARLLFTAVITSH